MEDTSVRRCLVMQVMRRGATLSAPAQPPKQRLSAAPENTGALALEEADEVEPIVPVARHTSVLGRIIDCGWVVHNSS
jgi:hypothetical protein